MGDRTERQFVRAFNATQERDAGPSWWADRAAASGSATAADLPDVRFAHDGLSFAAEEKTTDEPYVYVDPREIEALQDYAGAFGMHAVVIGRFKGERAWYVWNPHDMDRTVAGTYRGGPDSDWAAKIAHPDGQADGIEPFDLRSRDLQRALAGDIEGGVAAVEPEGVR